MATVDVDDLSGDPTRGVRQQKHRHIGDVGDFADPELRALYTSLVERADTPADALGVGVTIERLDIADLDDAMSGLTAPDVLNAYTHLRQGSQRHLAAFGG